MPAARYARPVAPVPAAWPGGAAAEGAARSPKAPAALDLPWREFVGDERLKRVIEQALANNRDLRIAALAAERARALYGIRRADLFPAADLSAAGSRERLSADLAGPQEPRTRAQYRVELGVASWEIDFFGRLRSLRAQALEEYLAAEEGRRAAQIVLVSSAAEAYLALAADRDRLAVARAALAADQAAHDLVRKRLDAGLATDLDLQRARTRVEADRAEIARLERAAAQDRNALDLVAGGPVPEDLLPSGLDGVAPFRGAAAGLPSEVLLRRPDVMAAERRLRGAHAQIEAARAAFFPRIALTTSAGTASDELAGLFGAGTGTWLFAPRVVMPVFDARIWAAYRATEVERAMLLAAYEKAIQTAFREAADALALRGTIDAQMAAQDAVAGALEAAHRLALERYEKGLDGYLGVLDAQRALYDARQGQVALRLAKAVGEVRLYAVLGGGVR